jgi:hypothetical protein
MESPYTCVNFNFELVFGHRSTSTRRKTMWALVAIRDIGPFAFDDVLERFNEDEYLLAIKALARAKTRYGNGFRLFHNIF